jgi:hypothetical protein
MQYSTIKENNNIGGCGTQTIPSTSFYLSSYDNGKKNIYNLLFQINTTKSCWFYTDLHHVLNNYFHICFRSWQLFHSWHTKFFQVKLSLEKIFVLIMYVLNLIVINAILCSFIGKRRYWHSNTCTHSYIIYYTNGRT